MSILDIIKSRRSIRSYKPDQISDSILQNILDAALAAPNGKNAQEWHFSVVQNKALLDRWFEIIKKNILNSNLDFFKNKLAENPDYNTFYHAPTVIVISGPESGMSIKVDCGAAAENMCLVAESLGLGSVVLGSPSLAFLSEEGSAIKVEIGIPDGYEYVVSVALGYTKGAKPAMPPRNKDVINYVK